MEIVLALAYFRVIFGRANRGMCVNRVCHSKAHKYLSVSSLHLYDPAIIWLQVGLLEVIHLIALFPGSPSPSGWYPLPFHFQPHLQHLPPSNKKTVPQPWGTSCDLWLCHPLLHFREFTFFSYSFLSAWSILSHFFHWVKYFCYFSDIVCKKTSSLHLFISTTIRHYKCSWILSVPFTDLISFLPQK